MRVARSDVTTWLDQVASLVGFRRLADRLPFDISPSMTAVLTGVVIDVFVLQPYQYLVGKTPTIVENPFWILTPLTILTVVYLTRSLHRRYEQALKDMRIEERTANYSQFQTLVPDRFRWACFLVFIGIIFVNLLFFITIPVVLKDGGIPALFGNVVLVPFVYVPVATDAIATYLGIQLVLPRRVENSDIELDFLDPERLGGLRPVGELIKHSYYYTAGAIIGFAVFIYAPTLFDSLSQPIPPTAITNLLFTAAWLIAAGVLGHSLYIFHRFMHTQKREKLLELDQQFREVVDGPWDITNHQIPAGKQERAAEIQEHMNRITSTKEYPATFAMWSQLLIGLILPKAVQIALSSV